jgi:hypothetical protein
VHACGQGSLSTHAPMSAGNDLTLARTAPERAMGISTDSVERRPSHIDSQAGRMDSQDHDSFTPKGGLNLMPNHQFSIRLSEQDWDATHKEWQCEALRVATLLRVVVAGKQIPTEVNGKNIKPLVDPGSTAARVELEINIPPNAAPDSAKPWKVLTALLAVLVPLAIAWVSTRSNVEIEKIKSEAEAAKARAESAKSAAEGARATAESDKARAETANRDCSKKVDELATINNCFASGGSRASCNNSTFNILSHAAGAKPVATR